MNPRSYPPNLRPYVFHGVNLDYGPGMKGGQGVCPFCDEPSFFVWAYKYGYTCKSCGESGNHYTFLKTLYQRSLDFFNTIDLTPYAALDPNLTTKSKRSAAEAADFIRKDKLAALMSAKSLTLEDIRLWGIVPSYITMVPLVPGYNESGSLANLYRVVQLDGKLRPLSTPQCKLHPYRILRQITDAASRDAQAAWAPEGLWDTITAQKSVDSLGLDIRVIGVPGASAFKPEWFDLYFPSTVTFLFDNDYPRRKHGRIVQPALDGLKSIFDMARQQKAIDRVRYISWGSSAYHDKSLPSGYDISDLAAAVGLPSLPQRIYEMTRRPKPKTNPATNAAVARNGHKTNGTPNSNKSTNSPKGGSNGKVNQRDPMALAVVKPIQTTSFTSLCKHYEACIHFSRSLQDTLAVMLAAVVSTPLDGDQLWFRIMGPPGSGKTTLAEAISGARDYVYPLSLNTGFHSGYKENMRDEQDHSLLAEMDNKTTVIKDADTLLKNSALERILSEMRDFYDRVSRASYRNAVRHHYEDLRITFLLCGTDALRSLNRTDVGERFLDCQIFDDDDASPYVDRAFHNTYALVAGSMAKSADAEHEVKSEKDRQRLRGATLGFIHHLRSHMSKRQPPSISPAAEQKLKAMAQFLAIIRARTKQDRETKEFVKSRVEIPTRLVSQIVKTAICLAIVLERRDVDDEVLRIIKKIIFDTGDSVELDIVKLLHLNPEGLSVRQISLDFGLSERAILNRLQSLRYFGAVRNSRHANNSGQRGRDVHIWKLADLVQKIYSTALDLPLPKPKGSTRTKSRSTKPRPKVKP